MEGFAKFAVEGISIVTHNLQATTLGRAFRSKRTHDDIPSGFHGACDLTNVKTALIRHSQKVKDRPIMPNVISPWLQLDLSYVGYDPTDSLSSFSQPSFVHVDGGLGNIQDRDVLESFFKSSTRVDSPPPTSIMDAARWLAERLMSASDVSKCGRYQLT